MASADEKMFQEALTAIDENNLQRARDLLTRLLRSNQDNPEYWLWMSAVVETVKERKYCLTQVLNIDPDNPAALRGMALLGEIPPDSRQIIPLKDQKRNWLAELEKIEVVRPHPGAGRNITMFISGIVLLIAIIIGSIAVISKLLERRQAAAVVQSRATLVVYPTATPKPPTATPIFVGPTPPWSALAATYTPTPLYVATPHNLAEAYNLAMRAYDRADWEAMINYLQQVDQSIGKTADIQYYKGEAYRNLGQLSQAIEYYHSAINLDPKFAPAYLGRARAVQASSSPDPNLIRSDLEKTVLLDPNYGEARLELASYYISVEKYADALSQIEKANLLLPDSALGFYLRAQIAYKLENYKQALINVDQALSLDVTLLKGYLLKGEIYRAMGNIQDSLDPLYIFTQYNAEKDTLALAWLGSAYAANAKYDQALQVFAEVLELDPKQTEVFLQRAKLYEEREEYELALSDYESATKLAPNSFPACIGMSELLLKLDRAGNAYTQLGRCKSTNNSEQAEIHYYSALALEDLGNSLAIKEWQRLLALPKGEVPAGWYEIAHQRVLAVYTETPTLKLTPTVITKTPANTQTNPN